MKKFVMCIAFLCAPALCRSMTVYVSTAGAATNSGCTDTALPFISAATVTVSGTTVQFPVGTDLSAVVPTTGAVNQSTVYIYDATNSYQKNFKINGVDDANDRITVTVAPTGAAVSSATIGGQWLLTDSVQAGMLGPGDIMELKDSPAASASTVWTCRTSGNNTTGPITMRGASGTRPIIKHTSTAYGIFANSQSYWVIENLEVQQTQTTGMAIAIGQYWTLRNVKVSDSANGISLSVGTVVCDSEFSGFAGTAVLSLVAGSSSSQIFGTYFHDNATMGVYINSTSAWAIIVNNIFDTLTGQAIRLASAPTSPLFPIVISNNTIYGCGDSGLEIADKDFGPVILTNNIFKDNGNAAGEYNFEQTGGTFNASGGVARNNIFNISGGVGGGNVYGYTLDATDLTTDPLFTNAASGDFSLQPASPAKASGFPGLFLGGPTGYLDIGAVQRMEPVGGGSKTMFMWE